MRLELKVTCRFTEDLRLAKARGCDLKLFSEIVTNLQNGIELDPKYKDRQISGNFGFYRECYIKPNWILIYGKDFGQGIMILSRLGSFSELF